MDSPAPIKPLKFRRWLPYWAVFQMDMRQTARSWLFRIWVLVSVCLSVAYLLHRTAIHHQAGIIQEASSLMTEVFRFALLVGTTLVIILTAGAISGERGIMADSVLSRGISRYQYFMGKWHSRLMTILGSFLLVGVILLVGSMFLLKNDVSILGCLTAMIVLAAILAVVVSCGITISSFCNSTVLAIALLWMMVYGAGVSFYLLETSPFNPARLLEQLPGLMQGHYNLKVQAVFVGWCLLVSFASALVGLIAFARRDV